METAESRLKETFFLVESTRFEQHCHWRDFADNSDRRLDDHVKFSWEQMDGFGVIIGHLSKRPVVMDISWVKIAGQLVAFWNLCSQVTDYKMAEKWIDKHYKKNYDFRTNADNFHHCVNALREIKENSK